MIPRLMSSKKWTPLPSEFCAQIESAVRQNYAAFLSDHAIEVEGRIYKEEILLRVGLVRPCSLRQANFQASAAFAANKEKAIDKIFVAMDLIGLMIEQFLRFVDRQDDQSAEDPWHEWPLQWQKETMKGHEIFVQFSSANTRLEAEANRLLGVSLEDKDTLVRSHAETDDTDDVQTIH